MLARFGAGVKTAVWAGLVAWLAIEVLPSIEWMPFPFYEKSFWVKVMALEILPMVIGAIATRSTLQRGFLVAVGCGVVLLALVTGHFIYATK